MAGVRIICLKNSGSQKPIILIIYFKEWFVLENFLERLIFISFFWLPGIFPYSSINSKTQVFGNLAFRVTLISKSKM